jgi:hypothetical protein
MLLGNALTANKGVLVGGSAAEDPESMEGEGADEVEKRKIRYVAVGFVSCGVEVKF